MLEIGSEVAGHRIERLLGRGGMGEVYEATQLALLRRVAFKVVRADPATDAHLLERFRREGRMQAALDHPHIVPIYEAGALDDGLYLAMRLVSGPTLKQLIAARALDADRTVAILRAIADALDTAHASGLVHRDVKPQNILVDADDHPYLADFGLVRTAAATALTRTGYFVGTLDYAAPEQIRGEDTGPAVDVYALAAVLFECLTGSVPFPRPSSAAVMYAHVNDPPPRADDLRDDLPPRLADLIAAGMAKRPEDRPATATELVQRAAELLEGLGSTRPEAEAAVSATPGAGTETEDDLTATDRPSQRPTPRLGRPAPRSRRRATGVAAAALAVAALAAVGFAAGRAGGGEEAGDPALTTSASSELVTIAAPAGWRRTEPDALPAIGDLDLAGAVGVNDPARPAAGVMAGRATPAGPGLLPAALAEEVAPEAVGLGRFQAWRYDDAAVPGFDRDLTLYAVPSTAGAVAIACYAPDGGAFATDCARVAGSLQISGGDPLPLLPPVSALRAVRTAARDLNAARRSGRADLERASRPTAQAEAADALARAYARASRRIAGVSAGPGYQPALERAARALDRAGAAYRRLGGAARAGRRQAYEDAAAAVRRAEAGAAEALGQLTRALAGPGQG